MTWQWLPKWAWTLVFRHLRSKHSRKGVQWINWFAFLGVGVGVFSWTLLMSVMSGLQGQTRSKILSQKPHIVWESTPSENVPSLIEKIKSDSEFMSRVGVIDITASLQSEGLVEVPAQGERGRTIGSGVIVEGRRDLGVDEVKLGTELLNAFWALGFSEQQSLKLYSAWDLKIPPFEFSTNKTFKSGIYQIDRSTMLMNLESLQEWLGVGNAYSIIEIRVKDPEKITVKDVQYLKDLTGLEFQSWQQRDAALWYSLKLEKFMIGLLIGFVLLIALIALNISMVVRVHERSQQVALLKALGSQEHIISRVFVTEGIVIAAVGGILGLALSGLAAFLISQFYRLPEIYYSTEVPVDWSWGLNLGFLALCLFMSAWVSYLPSRRLHRYEAAVILRS
jgi:lipoprotein-releasing system permease protein